MKAERLLVVVYLVVLSTIVQTQTLSNLYPSRKSWWAKQITDNIYVAGRLTESQIKFASESGFKTLVALSVFDTEEELGDETLPHLDGMRHVAVTLSGMRFETVLQPGEDWARKETVEKFTSIMKDATPPVLLTSFIGKGAAFTALAYLANQTTSDSSFRPRIDSAEFYGRAASLGYIFDTPIQTALVSDISGQPVVSNPPKPNIDVEDWANNYWLAKPVYRNVYIAGQIRSNYLQSIKDARYDVIINYRKGVVIPPDNKPSQEEVTLLNIKDRTGTYDGAGRQSEKRLLDTRLDPSQTNDYIGPASKVNYELRNTFEYGDDIGYNETLSRLDFEDKIPSIKYVHTPIGE